jgi:protease-4
VRELPPREPPARRGGWRRFFLVLVLLALVGSLLMNFMFAALAGLGLAGGWETERRVQEKFVSHNPAARDKVVILPIEGVILETEEGFVSRAIDHALRDDDVKAVVLRVNSPGGSVSGSDYLYHHLCRFADNEKRKIPLVVSMGGIAASGGYYVTMAVGPTPDAIFAEPTTFTGSIGVIIPHYNLADLMQKVGAEDDSIASNPLKMMGSLSKPMSEQERRIFQALVDHSFARFKQVVRAGRSKFERDPAALDRLATGQIYAAEQAQKNGLIDKIGFLEDAVDRAIALAGLDKDQTKVVRYKPEVSLSSMLLGSQARNSPAAELRALLEMTTPRAYYLATWLPGLAAGGE